MRLRNAYRLLAAAVCAAVATYLTVAFLLRGNPPPPPQVAVLQDLPRAPDTKPVVVATKPLPHGTVLTPDLLTEVQWPAAKVPPGAFSSREALVGAGGPRSTQVFIDQNEPIVPSKVTAPGQRNTLAAVIEKGMRAMAIRVDDVLGVGGFPQPGDRVDVIWTYNERKPGVNGMPASEQSYSVFLLQNVRVLAAGQDLDRGPKAKPAKSLTVEVDAEGAKKIALSANIGQLSLALLPAAGSQPSADNSPVGIEDLSGKRTPGEPAAQPPQKTEPGERGVVAVTRGTERSYYRLTESGRYEIKPNGRPVPSTPPQTE